MDLGVSDDAGYDGYVKSKNKNLTSASVFWWPHGPSLNTTKKIRSFSTWENKFKISFFSTSSENENHVWEDTEENEYRSQVEINRSNHSTQRQNEQKVLVYFKMTEQIKRYLNELIYTCLTELPWAWCKFSNKIL